MGSHYYHPHTPVHLLVISGSHGWDMKGCGDAERMWPQKEGRGQGTTRYSLTLAGRRSDCGARCPTLNPG